MQNKDSVTIRHIISIIIIFINTIGIKVKCIKEKTFLLTLLHALERDGVLSDKVIMRRSVIVLHQKPHQSQIRYINQKLKPCIPHRIETYKQ